LGVGLGSGDDMRRRRRRRRGEEEEEDGRWSGAPSLSLLSRSIEGGEQR
jgi:hypothetical protein